MSGGGAERALAPALDSERWFAVWTRSQCEPKVEELLRRRQLEVFLPRVRVASRRRDRHVVLERPLFPGYLFLRFAPSREAYIRAASTDGVVRILGDRWDALEQKGATKQRCLWASTSTKNPDYRDVMYVEELIGPATVNTMPEETIRAFQDHGEAAETLTQGVDEARRLLDDLAKAGVDYDDVVATLEEEGVQKFSDSFDELLDGIRAKRGELAPA